MRIAVYGTGVSCRRRCVCSVVVGGHRCPGLTASFGARGTRDGGLPVTANTSWKQEEEKDGQAKQHPSDTQRPVGKDDGYGNAMSRRLEQMTDEALSAGSSSYRMVESEAQFSDELRSRLEERLQTSEFLTENASAAAPEAKRDPLSTGAGTDVMTDARAQQDRKALADVSFRIFDDARLRNRAAKSTTKSLSSSSSASTGARSAGGPSAAAAAAAAAAMGASRVANARDQAAAYALAKQASSGMSAAEQEAFAAELKARFSATGSSAATARSSAGAGAVLGGLAALANERIEAAMAAGTFHAIPRGPASKTDAACSPFVDTTEYLMNQIVRRQDVVPPWIEKQQELAAAVTRFRSRLRADWRRHAARRISSLGGSLADQVDRAKRHAIAEAALQPRPRLEPAQVEKSELLQITADGLSQSTDSVVAESTVLHHPTDAAFQTASDDAAHSARTDTFTESTVPSDCPPVSFADAATADPATVMVGSDSSYNAAPVSETVPQQMPFRDEIWEAAEAKFLQQAVAQLNSLTRSYNLLAPAPVRRPYFSVERELRACFAEVAPQLPDEIERRAGEKRRSGNSTYSAGKSRKGKKGILDSLVGDRVMVVEDRRPPYGFRELWRDLVG